MHQTRRVNLHILRLTSPGWPGFSIDYDDLGWLSSAFMRPLLVLGDLLLDIYTWGDAERISPEAPVPVIRVDREEHRLGGAASVARLARGLEAEVILAGVGEDLAGRSLRRLLVEDGIDAGLVLEDSSRCTTTKERLVGRAAQRHPHQMVRIDREVLVNASL